MDKLSALLQDIEETICDDHTLIDYYSKVEGVTPLDILVEREKRQEAIAILRFAMGKLGQKDRRVLWMYAVKRMAIREIARRMGRDKRAICERIDRIHRKLSSDLRNHPSYADWIDTFRPPQSDKVAHAPECRGYPMDISMRVNVETVKVKLDGVIDHRSRWECRMPEYLSTSFGHSETVCTICDTCSRQEMRKLRRPGKTRTVAA